MKPNFALTLSFEGIGLLHRTQSGWHVVGDVPLDASDLAGELAGLAAKARALDPTGLRSKVVIPNDQIKYLSFESDSRDVDILEAQVRSALDGATPYHLTELAYDWSMRDGEVYVAAVAVETLSEAESFVVDHGFGPMSFVAIPDAGLFEGEPFLGETVYAGQALGPDEAVQRDDLAIQIVGSARPPEPDPIPEPASSTPPDEIVETTHSDVDAAEEMPASVSFSSARTVSKPDETHTIPTPRSELPKARFTPPEVAKEAVPAPKIPAEPPEIAPEPENVPPQTSETAQGAPEPTPTQDAISEPEATLEADDIPSPEEAAQRSATLRATDPAPPVRPAAKSAAPASQHFGRVSFLSRRKRGAQTEKRASTDGSAAGKGWGLNLGASLTKARAAARAVSKRKEHPSETASETSAQRLAAQSYADEKQRMTVFGARNPDNAVSERPRYLALMLTAALLLFLVAVATWAALFLEDGVSGLFRTAEDVQFAQEDEAESPVSETDDARDIAALSTGQDPEALADAPLAALDPLPNTAINTLTPDEARTRYAATGIWQMAPAPSETPGATALQDVYQTSLDPEVRFSDAVALPDAEALLGSGRPSTPADPPPPGSDFERDARGFIAATPEGTITPEGVTIFAGAPPVKPPPTPERTEPVISQTETDTPAPETATIRPRARPDDLNETFERNNNGGRTLAELADIRPRLRPKSTQELALEAAGIATVIEEGADPREDATAQAVAVSLTPRLRPEGFAAIVAETRAAAAADPVSIEQRVAVNIPTTASVARAATERNQISLRRVNLIGIYGKPSSRRALVRLANGRYRKVQVGDRLDGGQVAAIGEDELRYVKSGRSVVLKMPKG